MHLGGVLADELGGDVEGEAAELDEAAVPGKRRPAETPGVVADDVQRTEFVDKATDYALAGGDEGSRPDVNSSQRHCWPHGVGDLSQELGVSH